MSIREAHDGEADAVVDMFIWKYTFDVSSGVQDTESSNCRALFVQVQKGPTLWCYVWPGFSTRILHPRSTHLCTCEVDANSHTSKHNIRIVLYVYKQIVILALQGDG